MHELIGEQPQGEQRLAAGKHRRRGRRAAGGAQLGVTDDVFELPHVRFGLAPAAVQYQDLLAAAAHSGWCAIAAFLSRPGMRVPELTSQVLARCQRHLPRDRKARHGEAPVLLETFIDRSRHLGGCYRAANWQYVGDTRGRGRDDTAHAGTRSIKAIYAYPLTRDWRRMRMTGPGTSSPRRCAATGGCASGSSLSRDFAAHPGGKGDGEPGTVRRASGAACGASTTSPSCSANSRAC
ncbi:Druantia anti-phage system protein DruA [Aquisalimonas sp.]|uniref:Druantia anti-phage system protein DruA n=1 Tax=Aquisalimonas sp. TaxID=1872621 RepID=UPI0025C21D69|nr:Druantia anti-phage system protein DruA [Aquisalimonas sp.]